MSLTISIENVSVTFGNRKVLEDVNVIIEAGKLTSIIGPNGAGKTTLLKCILGTVQFEGTVKFLDEGGKMVEEPRLGYVPQHLAVDPGIPLTVLEFLSLGTGRPIILGIGKGKKRRIESLLSRVSAGHLVDKKVTELSGGELQRVMLARALADDPDVLLLDEPASGIDVAGEELFCELLEDIQKSTGKTVVLVSHDLSVVTKHADFVICLDKTVKCSGLPVEIMNRENITTLFGAHSTIYVHGEEHDPTCKHDGGGGND